MHNMKKKYCIILIVSSLLCILMLSINCISCKNRKTSTYDGNIKPVPTETMPITYFHQVDSSAIDTSYIVTQKPQIVKRNISRTYEGMVRDQVDLFYCDITNEVLLKMLKSKVKQIPFKDINSQKIAYIDNGLQINTDPIVVHKATIENFINSNFFTLIDDSIEIVIGAEDTRSARYLKSWIKIDSTKTRKCEIFCDTACHDGIIDPPPVKREEIYYISYIVSKNDSGKIIPTEDQLDSIAYAKKIRETF